MSATLQLDCPHCDTQRVAFTVMVNWPAPRDSRSRIFAAKCGHCFRGVIGLARSTAGSTTYDLMGMQGDFGLHNLELLEVFPAVVEIVAPDHVPDNLSNYYAQGIRALKHESWDAAGIMFRKVLEVATKSLHPSSAKKSLIRRIDDMRQAGVLTQDLAEWAHEIRTEGNDAAHDEEPFLEEDAQALRDFCEYFLVYTYTLPRRIALRRSADEPASEK